MVHPRGGSRGGACLTFQGLFGAGARQDGGSDKDLSEVMGHYLW
jgi:hypothetical protein